MSVTKAYFNSDELLSKVCTTQKALYEQKIVRQLEAYTKNVTAAQKQLEASQKVLKEFQDKIDACHTEEHAKTFCSTF